MNLYSINANYVVAVLVFTSIFLSVVLYRRANETKFRNLFNAFVNLFLCLGFFPAGFVFFYQTSKRYKVLEKLN
jgi:glucan phosphoethanolaminetransferase (alkaline phosphatase superfamily)